MIYIGVDGGGTKTALSAYADGVQIATAVSGPVNYHFIGIDAATEHLMEGIEALGIPQSDIAAIGIGDPAIDDSVPQRSDSPTHQLIRRLEQKTGAPVYLRSDAYMTLFSLTGGGSPAVLMLSGTGAMGIAENRAGELTVAGGWGRLTGDEGSGYYIAVQGIQAALRAHDGIRPATRLTDALCRHFDVNEPRALIDVFYGEGDADIAGFARTVDRCALEGDRISIDILHRSAAYLFDYTSRLLQWSEASLVGVYGSVLCRSTIVRAEFERLISLHHCGVGICEPTVSPQQAAAMYAQKCFEKESRR